jgi:hypothetical protein
VRNLIEGFGPQIVLVAMVAVAGLVCALASRGSRPGPFRLHWPAAWLAAGSLAGIVIGTLTRRSGTARGGSIELEPFHTLRSYLHIRQLMAERGLAEAPRPRDFPRYGLRDVPVMDNYQTTEALVAYAVGNVALFVPLGFFVYFAIRRSALLATLAGAATSLSVEILQLPIWSRSTDIDDVILNTTGTALGALAAVVVARLLARRRPALLFPPEPEAPQEHSPDGRVVTSHP